MQQLLSEPASVPVDASIDALLALRVPFDSALTEVSGVILDVFPPERGYQNVYIGASAQSKQHVYVRISERDEVPKSFKGPATG